MPHQSLPDWLEIHAEEVGLSWFNPNITGVAGAEQGAEPVHTRFAQNKRVALRRYIPNTHSIALDVTISPLRLPFAVEIHQSLIRTGLRKHLFGVLRIRDTASQKGEANKYS